MYTSVESRPEAHPTKRTTFVRLDGERKITIGVEDGTAPRVDTQYNFNGLVTDYEIPGAEPNIAYVHAEGECNGIQTCRIAVRMYHGADATGENLPIGGEYGYEPDKCWYFRGDQHYDGIPVELLYAHDISHLIDIKILDTESQGFPVELWNITDISRAGALPGENTEPSLITDAMIREQHDSQAISEGRGINYNTRYSNLGEFLNHLGEVCNEREYFFRGEPKHYKPEPLSTDVITSRLCREVSHDFNNVVKYSLNVEAHGIRSHQYVPGWPKQYEADLLQSLFRRQIAELCIAKSPSLWKDNSYSQALADEARGLPRNAEEANFSQEDLQPLAEIQHYGGSTILIDFTKSLKVALFFACENKDKLDEDGRLMLLPKENEGKMWDRISPSKSFTRYRKQESVLVVPKIGCLFPNGSASPSENDDIQCVLFNIPKELKQDILEYLENLPREGVTHKSLDIHGDCERIPDNIREYIEGQKSRVQKTFVPATSNTRVRLIAHERF